MSIKLLNKKPTKKNHTSIKLLSKKPTFGIWSLLPRSGRDIFRRYFVKILYNPKIYIVDIW